MRREYKKPPVNELVIGVYFAQPLLGLRAEHIGIFWKRLEKDFPGLEQQAPIKDLFIPAPNEQFPLPRYWLKSSDERYLIQIQRNAFLLNWRKRGEGDYPHYKTVKEAFDKHYLEFAEFVRSDLKSSELAIELCELSYVNLIESGATWTGPDDIAAVIPSYQSLKPTIPGAKLTEITAGNVFQVSNDLTLTVTLRTARRGKDKTPILFFEQRASGQVADGTKGAADAWFDRAHEITGACFNSMTSAKFQNDVWQLKGSQ